MLEKSPSRQLQGLRDGLSRDASVPLLDHRLPGQAIRELVQNVGDQDASAAEGGLAVADRGIADDVSPHELRSHDSCLLGKSSPARAQPVPSAKLIVKCA